MMRLRNDIAREVGMSSRISPAAPMAMTRKSRGHGHVIVSILPTSLRIHLVIYIQKSHSLSYIAFVKCATVQTDLEMKPWPESIRCNSTYKKCITRQVRS